MCFLTCEEGVKREVIDGRAGATNFAQPGLSRVFWKPRLLATNPPTPNQQVSGIPELEVWLALWGI